MGLLGTIWVRRRSGAQSNHLRGLARAFAYVTVLACALGTWELRMAHAEVGLRTLEFGRRMADLARTSQHDVNKLTINGQPMWVGSTVSNGSVNDVLNRYEATCRADAAQPVERWREVNALSQGSTTERSLLPDGILRAGDEHEGTLVCFTKGDGSKPTLRESLLALAQTGELGALGSLRYVYARTSARTSLASADPARDKSLVVTAWTDRSFNLRELTAEDGRDALGADFPGIPRPLGSQRVFAANLEGTPFGVNVYRSKGGPATVIASFDSAMMSHGWLSLDPELDTRGSGTARVTGAVGRLFEKEGVVLTVASSRQDHDTVTAVGLAGVTPGDRTETESSGNRGAAPRDPADASGSALGSLDGGSP